MGMDTRLVAMDGEADDVLLAPLAARKVVGVPCPLKDAFAITKIPLNVFVKIYT